MSKINLDKYYTDKKLAKKCINLVQKYVKDISEYIEPSAGDGSFSLQLDSCIAYDIEPEHSSIIRQDFLELKLPYLKNRCIIGNPPFGQRMLTAQKFFRKATELGDYIAFILPISQLWNTNSLYEFDLIYSEDLGKVKYSGKLLHCCFNIYKRPKKGLNKRTKNHIEGIKIIRQDSKAYKDSEYDLRLCYWGNGCAGKILKENESYSAEYKIIINHPMKEEIIQLLRTVNWWEELNCIAMLKIQQFHIINLIKKYVLQKQN